jgi:hypothetical protein
VGAVSANRVVVALAEPKSPLTCWARVGVAIIIATRTNGNDHTAHLFLFIALCFPPLLPTR